MATNDEPTSHSTLNDLTIQALLARKDVPEDFQLADELFGCIPRDLIRTFLDNRAKLIDAKSGSRGGGTGIPSQYGATGSANPGATKVRANAAKTGNDTEDHDDTQGTDNDKVGALAGQLDLLTRALTANANLNRSAMTSRVIHVNLSDDKRQKI